MSKITKDKYEKLIKFAKENTTLKEYTNSYYGTKFKRRSFKCPCCEFESWNGISDEEDESILIGFRGYLIHLNSRIRLHASKCHIKLMEELFGEEITLEFLRLAIAKNKSVTLELERIYQEYKECKECIIE